MTGCFHVHRRDLGLLLLRVGIGGALTAHGTQKLFGWFGGGGIEGTGTAMESMGYIPGRPSAIASGLAEAGGGTLLALGLATPFAGAAASGGMAGAAAVHAPNGFFTTEGGYELPAAFGTAAASLALTGPGRYSVDHAIGHVLDRDWMVPLALVASAVAAVCVVGTRQRRLRAEPTPAEAP
ncbi:DoxX family membrane protein [Streptomyces sp. SID4919]|uniref:DoxX family protein n=1 Tax=Streptomyces TaxID=1883 RepID=UPI000823E30F|nr:MULTISPECIES: DoxX family membrane protein [unclassified Streptomyces]MYY09155.1 DoxX family membrane protein [Streptomyces sp. SID4919]WST70773.1 DoxX family membrane protein [Streptomyces uncialis]SCK29349.1 putative oxidoreductase [Streptomyces sp. AmelKG-E11A]